MKKFLFILTTGFALFSMHFGSGNLVFPLYMGASSEAYTWAALSGLLLTAVGLPMIGFLAIIKLEGSTRRFFNAFGSHSGLFLMTAIISILCPLGAMPRCIALTHTIMQELFSSITPALPLFCIAACLLIYGCTYKKQVIVPLLGTILTPLLLVTLALILVSGIIECPTLAFKADNAGSFALQGLFQGYQMMDLLAALFFSRLVFIPLERFAKEEGERPFTLALGVAAVAGTLLAFSYIGFGFLAQAHSELLKNTPPEMLLVRLSEAFLGPIGAYATATLAILACLTTAIALGVAFSEFLQKELLQLSYSASLVITLSITYMMATMSFSGIVSFLGPILDYSYPLLIALSLYHLVDYKSEKAHNEYQLIE
jgi:LIVCS family branched-chain amino acid:cation transporter